MPKLRTRPPIPPPPGPVWGRGSLESGRGDERAAGPGIPPGLAGAPPLAREKKNSKGTAGASPSDTSGKVLPMWFCPAQQPKRKANQGILSKSQREIWGSGQNDLALIPVWG